MAKEDHVTIIRQGVEAWNKWRQENLGVIPDIGAVDLNNKDLSGIDLSGANLSMTNFGGTDLSGAFLTGANLHDADLYDVDLSEAILYTANLNDARLKGANLTKAICGYTIFGKVDLSQVKGLETVRHNGPSTVGIDTIYLSGGNIPAVFLRGAGVPDTFITFMESLTGQAIDFYSCFISHSNKDKEFVERLYSDLQSRGVRCWYAPHDLIIGEPFVSGIDKGIRLHDKLLLILSEHSVASEWIDFEVNLALTKEKGKEPWVLFPIRLDNTVMQTDLRWANMIRESRHIGDFTQWKDHDSYKKAFDKLLSDLKGKS